MTDSFNHLGSIWYQSEPLEVPCCPNQLLGLDFFCCFLKQTGSRTICTQSRSEQFWKQNTISNSFYIRFIFNNSWGLADFRIFSIKWRQLKSFHKTGFSSHDTKSVQEIISCKGHLMSEQFSRRGGIWIPVWPRINWCCKYM